MVNTYARIINHYKFKDQTLFPARPAEQDEDDEVLDDIELYISLKVNENLTESDVELLDLNEILMLDLN